MAFLVFKTEEGRGMIVDDRLITIYLSKVSPGNYLGKSEDLDGAKKILEDNGLRLSGSILILRKETIALDEVRPMIKVLAAKIGQDPDKLFEEFIEEMKSSGGFAE